MLKKPKEIKISNKDSLSNSSPFRIVNIGNSKQVSLMTFINVLETFKQKIKKKFVKNQKGEVKETFSNCDLLYEIVKFRPDTDINEGLKKFINWYKNFYKQDG